MAWTNVGSPPGARSGSVASARGNSHGSLYCSLHSCASLRIGQQSDWNQDSVLFRHTPHQVRPLQSKVPWPAVSRIF